MSPAFLVTGANRPVGYEVRIKILKRQMFGRTKLALLRKRVLPAT